jgi:hypothetical protein
MSLDTSAKRPNEGSVDYYGHEDYYRDKAAGMSDYDIKQLIDADTGRMGNGGTSGELYQQIANNARPPSNNNNNGGGQVTIQPYPNPSSGGQQMAGSQEFQNNLNEATQAYRPDESKKNNFEGTSHDFRRGVNQENAIKDNDPFGDSWNSIDFFGKYITMGREAQKGRGDASSIVDKYIFKAQQTNPVNIQALDQQIRTSPLYSEAKATLGKKNVFGDQYAADTPNFVNPGGPSPYEQPDFNKLANPYLDRIEDMEL